MYGPTKLTLKSLTAAIKPERTYFVMQGSKSGYERLKLTSCKAIEFPKGPFNYMVYTWA